ncbi:MAG: histidinol dehydrogenase, partial [Clostridia bacterium]|nr:histidinol dehydrogenase [Clostridia bacterium]
MTGEILNREIQSYTEIEPIVREIIDNVIKNGDKQVKEYTKKFDGADLDTLLVSDKEIEEAVERIDKNF